ncbi:protein translocase SEC61 complex subunit gamma [Candidatus Micrarchaeota archaeon]|nr:protein translocase SEC61 complex subunit gamma [Candidatus Micrarchaeota archaeon]
MFDVGKFLNSTKRIFTVSKKPDMSEYKIMSQVTGIGIIIIGAIAFVIMLIFHFVPFLG